MSKPTLRIKARRLRKQGLGIKTIASQLSVSSSTASRWCKDVTLSQAQLLELQRRAHDPFYGKRALYLSQMRQNRQKEIDRLNQIGVQEINHLAKRELFIAGVALYWAEGFKKDNRLGFANSDPAMIRFFLRWLTACCKVPKNTIRVRVGLNISHKHRLEVVEQYWSKITNLPITQFQKPFFQKFIWKKDFPNPDSYMGVLRVRANQQLTLFRKIHGWIEGLKLNIIK